MNKDLKMLLFSGGQSEMGKPYYHYAHDWVNNYLLPYQNKNILFISWAVWNGQNADKMFSYGQEHWGQFGLKLTALHQQPDFFKAINGADSIIVGGGSVHMLVNELEKYGLMTAICQKINSGALYIGTSAGAIITGPTMHTSSEPPIIHVASHKTLNILPFQMTAHFYDHDPDEFHHGPTPIVRIKNYLSLNPDPKPVVCLRDGSFLEVNDGQIIVRGIKPVTVFDRSGNRTDFNPDQVLTWPSA